MFNLGERKFELDLMFILFGMGSWLGMQGMYMQLPHIVDTAPEGWTLPSFITVVGQIANIGPLLYTFFRRHVGPSTDKYLIYILLLMGAIAMMLMAWFYQHTTFVAGAERSVIFLALEFFVALLGCTSSILFYPFMRFYKDIYLTTYLVGEGMSGFVPAIIALIQGARGNPMCTLIVQPDGNITQELSYPESSFSPSIFMTIISFLIVVSFLSFFILNNTRRYDSEKVKLLESTEVVTEKSEALLSRKKYIVLLLLTGVVNAIGNGIYFSIQTYSALPYGNTAYHLAVTLSAMANPVACFMAVFLPHTSNLVIASLTSGMGVLTVYVITTALMSPTPPLWDDTLGVVVVVIVWILAVGLFSYIKLCTATVFRQHSTDAMFLCGAVTQLGSFIGSVSSFLVINLVDGLFTSSDPCMFAEDPQLTTDVF